MIKRALIVNNVQISDFYILLDHLRCLTAWFDIAPLQQVHSIGRQVYLIRIIDTETSAAVMEHLSLLIELVTHTWCIISNVGRCLNRNVEF